MKKIFVYAAAAALAMTAISCQKESLNENGSLNDALVFTASIDGGMDTKTTLTPEKMVNWEATDEITVNGVVYTAAPKSDATKADFTKKNSGDADPTGTFYAFYPTGIQTEATAGGTLPAEQTYDAEGITNVPMFATSTTTSLSFKNICAVLAVTVKSSDIASVKSIKVSSSNCALSGAFTVSDGQKAVLTDATTVANTVTLNCVESAVATDENGTVFYIAIPAQTYQNLKIELSSDGENYTESMTTRKGAYITVAVNTVYPITFKADPVFSVSATKTVQFTKGNLWWGVKSPDTEADWHLEESQTAYPTEWSADHVGHFYWSKTATVAYAENYSDSGASTEDAFFCGEGNELTVDGQSDLYALSSAEWTYLLSSTSAGGRGDGDSKFKTGVTVNGVAECLVIAPDGYTGSIASLYDATAWATAEASGLVCLPAAGSRSGSDLYSGGSFGYYWSATPDGRSEDRAYYLNFYSGNVYPSDYDYRYDGCCVRLVCAAQ